LDIYCDIGTHIHFGSIVTEFTALDYHHRTTTKRTRDKYGLKPCISWLKIMIITCLAALIIITRTLKSLYDGNSEFLDNTVCPQSPLGVLKNCGAQTNWASHMWFVAERGSNNSCEARRVDFVELHTNDARIVPTHSSLTPGLPLLLRSWTLPVSRSRCKSLIA
jgi:hypothetical protein